MSFVRFCFVLAVTICAAGIFGAVVGGLLGYAVPSSMKVIFGVSAHDSGKDKTEQTLAEGGGVQKEAQASVLVNPEKSIAAQGAAIGAAVGLMLGAIAGVVLGVADQFVLLLRGLWGKPKERTAV